MLTWPLIAPVGRKRPLTCKSALGRDMGEVVGRRSHPGYGC